jgi:HAD superfamily hydrolase (TIGR01509 family)
MQSGGAVILDMDGLMLDTEPVAWRAFLHAADVVACEFGEDIFNRLLGLNNLSARQLLRSHYGDAFRLDEFLEAVRVSYEASLQSSGVAHKAGLLTFLDFLDEQAIPRAVATSTATEPARDVLQRAGVLDRFSIVVGGDQIARGKPDPDIFLLAAGKLGVRPADCVVVEDSEPGVRAARAAGMTAILIPDLKQPGPEVRALANAVVARLDEAIPVVRSALKIAPSPVTEKP